MIEFNLFTVLVLTFFKNASLKVELERVRRERDTYRTEAYTLAHRQNQLQCQREAQVWNENEVLR